MNISKLHQTRLKTRNVEQHICPHDLDLKPSDPKINMGHLQVITKLHVKYKGSVMNGFHDNQLKPFGLPTDIPTNQPTLVKQYTPSSLKGGITTLEFTEIKKRKKKKKTKEN